jgi:leucyl/phenylalanyl-tRNA--protein transferase
MAIGRAFYGESMFSRVSDASKIALAHLARYLERKDSP